MVASPSLGVVLLVEDNIELSEPVGEFLEQHGFEVDYAMTGMEAYQHALDNPYDAIVLDVTLPRMSGLDVCSKLRSDPSRTTPVLMISGLATLEDKLAGLDAGADDYLTKPFSPAELVARLSALIRRDRRELGAETIVVADLKLDPVLEQVWRGSDALVLTPIGFKVLKVLMRASPRVIGRREIEQEIWGSSLPDSDTLRSHIYNLRKQIDKPYDRALLHTMQSAGYQIADLAESAALSS